MNFIDGIVDLYNSIANTRTPQNRNTIVGTRVDFSELNEIYKTGLGNKIVRLKSSYATKTSSLFFENEEDREFYSKKLQSKVQEALKWAFVFGRGIIVINDGGDLSAPIKKGVRSPKFDVFSGDMVSITSYNLDLSSSRYYEPVSYNVNGFEFHHSRVIDFTYVKPSHNDIPLYNHGGISEFELIYNQLINDGVVERSSSSIVEKNSSFFYKVSGFKQALASKKEADIVKFYSIAEDRRSIYGAGIIDKDDEVVTVSQSLTNLKDADDISLRRVAMVSGIPVPMLVGENVKGMNSSGEQEKTTFNEMIENIQEDYVIDKIVELFEILGLGEIKFKDNQNVKASEKVAYETSVIDNAMKLYNLGYDIDKYIKDRGLEVEPKNDFISEFPEDEKDV